MGEYKIYVGGNLDLAKAVVDVLYKGGGWWHRSGVDKHKPFDQSGAHWVFIGSDGSVSYASAYCDWDNYEELTLHDIFRDTSKWSVKAKEMTVSEISKELGYEVKIVK